jgi:hypothetical protein
LRKKEAKAITPTNNCLLKTSNKWLFKFLISFSTLSFVSSIVLVFIEPSLLRHLSYFIPVIIGLFAFLVYSIALFALNKPNHAKQILVIEGGVTITFFLYLVLSLVVLGLPTAFVVNSSSDTLTITFMKYFLVTLLGAGSLILIRYFLMNLLEKFSNSKAVLVLAFLSVCLTCLYLTVLGILHAIDGSWFLLCLDLGLASLFFVDYCAIKNGNSKNSHS